MNKFKLLSISLLVIIASFLVSCGMTGEGDVVDLAFETDPFSGISNYISADIHITKSNVRSVEISAQQNIINNILLEVKDGIMAITFRENVRKYTPININISIPELSTLNIYGSGSMNMTNTFDSCSIVRMGISGSGSINADLNSNSKTYSVISGSGNIYLKGSCPDQEINISGSGFIHGFLFNTNHTLVTISGSGSCEVIAENTLNVTISGSGNLFYKSHPVVQSSITGSGKIYNSN
jgi:Putative auto-transporter adhesin, head GIN domain